VLAANILAIPLFLLTVPLIVRMAALQREHMVPFGIAISLFAAVYQTMMMGVIIQFVVASALGMLMRWLDWSRAAFLLGFIMGPLAEISFIQTSQIWGWAMFGRPATIGLVLVFGILGWKNVRASQKRIEIAQGKSDALAAVSFFLFFAFMLWHSLSFPPHASKVPALVAGVGVMLALAIVILGGVFATTESQDETVQFEGVGAAVLFVGGVLTCGLPLASTFYAMLILFRMQVRWRIAIMSALCLGAAQLALFSLTSALWGEPLVLGYLAALLY
jgi:hypothetical protein